MQTTQLEKAAARLAQAAAEYRNLVREVKAIELDELEEADFQLEQALTVWETLRGGGA